jgi:C4-dicarboxylate-specific signal transduction histidine kinase
VQTDISIPTGAVPLESILCTEELHSRPSRPPQYEEENCALVKLIGALADAPQTILQTLAEIILNITQCDSAGLSLLTRDGITPDVWGNKFYWPAIVGMWNPHIGGGTPRNFGPCGDVLDKNCTLLFRHFERRYPYLLPVSPAAEECLLVPFYVAGEAVGTIWAIMHSDRRKFDAEDDRVMASLGKFASSAYQTLMHIEDLKFQVSKREKAETELRKLTDGLEAEVRLRIKELERSKALLAEAQHLSSIGSFSWRVASDEITWSDELYRIFELDPPLTIGRIRTRAHLEDVGVFDKAIDGARGAGNDFECQYRLMMPNGSIKHVHVVAHATRDQDGQLEYIAAVQDVTERRRAEEALDEARSELAHVARVMSLGALTASIAHEVNQPLSGIITNASTCLRMLDANPPNIIGARETARRTIRDGNRASEVITRLRALFSRRQATTESVDLNEATREVIALLLSKLQRNGVVLRSELADDLPLVTGDRVQLQQVIMNLLQNASDAMIDVHDCSRQLLIQTQRDEAVHVRLTVQDNGIGLDPQTIGRLFDAFYTTKNRGMGLGLSVSRSIIENHQGRIWAKPNDGAGATFSFSIPRSPVDAIGSRLAYKDKAADNRREVVRNFDG